MPDFNGWSKDALTFRVADSLEEHRVRMYYDAWYKSMVTYQQQLRWIKREFLDQICKAVDGPMAEHLHRTFDPELREPTFDG